MGSLRVRKRDLVWIETPIFMGWGCSFCPWKWQLPKIVATAKAPSLETRNAFLHHKCARPSSHNDVRWNKENKTPWLKWRNTSAANFRSRNA